MRFPTCFSRRHGCFWVAVRGWRGLRLSEMVVLLGWIANWPIVCRVLAGLLLLPVLHVSRRSGIAHGAEPIPNISTRSLIRLLNLQHCRGHPGVCLDRGISYGRVYLFCFLARGLLVLVVLL